MEFAEHHSISRAETRDCCSLLPLSHNKIVTDPEIAKPSLGLRANGCMPKMRRRSTGFWRRILFM